MLHARPPFMLEYTNVDISIFGLGYVGTVSAVCLSNSGHRVIGVDVNSFKVESINQENHPSWNPGWMNCLTGR